MLLSLSSSLSLMLFFDDHSLDGDIGGVGGNIGDVTE